MKKIFLGGLPKYFTDDRLRDMFSKYGEIVDYIVMKDSTSKESRGFGFVEFSTEEPVNQILKNRPHIIDNREIEVRRAMPKDITHNTIHDRTKRVFIGGLKFDITEEHLKNYYNEKFANYGHVESVEVKKDRNTNQSRGFAFITFDSEDAVDAVLILEPKPSTFGRNCEVKKSEPRRVDGHKKRSNSRSRRRSHSRDRYSRYEYDVYRRSPRDDYDRSRRSYRPPYDDRGPPYDDRYDGYPPPHRYERVYERSPPPMYRRYPPVEPSNMYREDRPHDRSYPAHPSYAKDYSYSSYPPPYSPPNYHQPSTPPPRSSMMNNNPTPNRPLPSGYAPRGTPQYREFDKNIYRDRDNNNQY